MLHVKEGKEIYKLEGHSGPLLCVSFSPDGNCIVSEAGDATIRVWDAKSGKVVHKLEGHIHLSSILSARVRKEGTVPFSSPRRLWARTLVRSRASRIVARER